LTEAALAEPIDFSDVDDDTATFLSHLTGQEPPKKPEEVEEVPDAANDAEAPTEAAETAADPDDPELDFEIGETPTKVKMSELRDLVTRRAEFEKTSAEVAATRTSLTDERAKADAAYKVLVSRAETKLAPYANLDWLTLRRDLDDNSWDQLRQMHGEAKSEHDFLTTEYAAHIQKVNGEAQASYAAEAQKALAELTGPADKGGIEGFGQELYGKMVDYAVSKGMPRELIMGTVNPAAVRLIHKAMLYDQSQTQAATVAAKIAKTPVVAAKVAAPTGRSADAQASNPDLNRAMSRLSKSGSTEDAEAAFMALLSRAD
jgi:hypothetical protein